MNHWGIYRFLLKFKRTGKRPGGETLPEGVEHILRKYRVFGASLALFDENGLERVCSWGWARKGVPVEEDTLFRTASVSKHVTALCVMKLWEDGALDLDADISSVLPFPVRHPEAPDTPVTLRMLLSHTAGIRDGASYFELLEKGGPLTDILKGDSFCDHLPGTKWEYSNLGAGIIGCVLECITGMRFDELMDRVVFSPLGVRAGFYPQLMGGKLADAWRILPASKVPCYDAEERLRRPLPVKGTDPEHHYALAHGNLCITAGDLGVIGHALLVPGFLKESTLKEMRRVIVPFGERAFNLSQGLGTFVLKDETISPCTIYGHQGLAYGAVHGIFYNPVRGRGFVLLTSGASEARRGVLTDLNGDLIRELIG
ncbi:MAG: hypothetical protein CW338_11260 [Clostridiales bacterium]|nr:hypothetical protein [Clostridiales bacterium]